MDNKEMPFDNAESCKRHRELQKINIQTSEDDTLLQQLKADNAERQKRFRDKKVCHVT